MLDGIDSDFEYFRNIDPMRLIPAHVDDDKANGGDGDDDDDDNGTTTLPDWDGGQGSGPGVARAGCM